jgi:hypothetical protein
VVLAARASFKASVFGASQGATVGIFVLIAMLGAAWLIFSA